MEEKIKAILEKEPHNVECLIQLANIYLKKGKITKGFSVLVEANEINPKIVAKNSLSKVIPFAQKVTNLKKMAEKSNDIKYWNELANGYFSIGILDEAIINYKKSLKINPNQSDIHFKLALAYKKDGRIYSCIDELKKVLKLNPKNLYANYYIGKILKYNLKNRAKSIEYFQKAKELLIDQKENFKYKKYTILLNDIKKELTQNR